MHRVLGSSLRRAPAVAPSATQAAVLGPTAVALLRRAPAAAPAVWRRPIRWFSVQTQATRAAATPHEVFFGGGGARPSAASPQQPEAKLEHEHDVVPKPRAASGSSPVTAPSGTSPVQLRDNAVKKLKSLQEQQQNSVLRLMVSSGGCSGYSYEFSLVKGAESADDVLVERDGAQLVVDEVSITFLEDCEIDYVEEMIRSSFQVVKNRLADSKCGCGSSFSVAGF